MMNILFFLLALPPLPKTKKEIKQLSPNELEKLVRKTTEPSTHFRCEPDSDTGYVNVTITVENINGVMKACELAQKTINDAIIHELQLGQRGIFSSENLNADKRKKWNELIGKS